MKYDGKKIMILGFGMTGKGACEYFLKREAKVYIYEDDIKQEEVLKYKKEYSDKVEFINKNEILNVKYDFVVKSPGIKPSNDTVVTLSEAGYKIFSDIEILYRDFNHHIFIGITGTNGKTTTTTLLYEILKNSDAKVNVIGNIGKSALSDADKYDVHVIELSSFQLEYIYEFKPKIAAILNITPDHLDWHGSFKNYENSKKKIYMNMDISDNLILNYNEHCLKDIKSNAHVLFFDINGSYDADIFYKEGKFYMKKNSVTEEILSKEDIFIKGTHNYENIMAAYMMAYSYGVDEKTIKDTIKKFKGVEHRIEYVRNIGGVDYYNDSKGTNPDASIKAVESFENKIVLIAGGYDKNIPFDEFAHKAKNKLRKLILMGETKDKIKTAFTNLGFNDIIYVNNMKEAVDNAHKYAKKGDVVVLSPLCASWDMYNSYEERGKDFKNCVNDLEE